LKILITGGNNSKAFKLLKAFPDHFVLLADYGDVPAVITENYALTSLGAINKESTAHILLEFCITEAIDCIIPIVDFEVEAIAKSSVLFNEYDVQVLLPKAESINNYLVPSIADNKNWAVFIDGVCIFATDNSFPQNQLENLNGIFYFDNNGYKLFTV
jgi:hypothetical protein